MASMKHVARLIVLTSAFSMVPFVVQAASLKCGQGLVSDGDTQLKVLARCGEPASKQTRTVVIRQQTAPGQEIFVQKQVDEWIYAGSTHRFSQHVVFEDGRLVDVRSGDYGP